MKIFYINSKKILFNMTSSTHTYKNIIKLSLTTMIIKIIYIESKL
jgi:hypothetical protein